MRLPAILPLLFTLTALILSILCVFAGSKRGYLENADIVTLNTSMLGRVAVTPSSSSSSSLLGALENDLKGGINKLAEDIAQALDLHDFYSWHILDYCEGYYTPSPITNATSDPAKNVTHCSNQTTFFHFDPTAVLQSELKTGINLTELKWPQAIEDAVQAVEVATNAMFVLYCIGIATTGVAVLGSVMGMLAGGRFSALVNLMLAMLAFLALGIASAIVTVIMCKVTNAVNDHGKDVGVAAYKGTKLLGMTWAATILMLLAAFAWVGECMMSRRK